MLLVLLIYFAEVVDNLNYIIDSIFIVSIIIFAICTIIKIVDSVNKKQTSIAYKKIFKISLIILTVAGLLHIILPSSKSIYLMVGVYTGKVTINNPKMSYKLNEIDKIIDKKLDKVIKEYDKK